MKCLKYIIHKSTSAPNMYHHLYQESESTMHQYDNKMNYNQDVSSCMYSISTIKHVSIILLVGASNNVPKVYQSCILDSLSTLNHISPSYTQQLGMPTCNHENLQQTCHTLQQNVSDPATESYNIIPCCNSYA
jgi:hypothetical protein